MSDHRIGHVFRELDPPPGGRSALRRRLGEERPPALFRVSRVLAVTAALVLAVAGVWLAAVSRPAGGLDFPDSSRPLRMSLGLLSPPTEAARTPASEAGRQALLEITSERGRVSLYWVSSLPESEL